jgi:hypothetical protein
MRLFVALLAFTFAPAPAAGQGQAAGVEDLVGTWTLQSIEQGIGSPQVSRPAVPRGLLVFDRAGHVFELVMRSGRPPGRAGGPAAPGRAGGPPAPEPPTSFATFAGFWGSYQADPKAGTITYKPQGGASPNLMGGQITRTIATTGTHLTVTSGAGEPHTQGITRWTWERVPGVENLSPTYRQVIGFWQHVVEKRVNVTTGEVLSETTRAPSIIVYTPSGYVGVHFPPRDRPRFAGIEPTDAEAAAALRGYVGYFGALTVYPAMVFHHVLSGVNFQGTTLKRPLEMSGQEVTIKFPPTTNPQGQSTSTWVTLRRLSGETDMLPKSSPR